ncbi:hypothetical protein P43SY_004111 [Pythium insidiosum]|uniref:Uncharacterized protein n=1 Tax=Pythium insidiosum TaxID=114742 RepID=A0AAD5LLS5_PYTIN|nr:hypothetical protein P43SY_004111 [Pythium insidiosum]
MDTSSSSSCAAANGDADGAASSIRPAKGSGIPRPSRLPSRRLVAPWNRSADAAGDGGNEDADTADAVDPPRTQEAAADGDGNGDGDGGGDSTSTSTATTAASRETTPFSSPSKATRLREPGWLKRKRPREEIRAVVVAGRQPQADDAARRPRSLIPPPLPPSSVSSSQATALNEDGDEQEEPAEADSEQDPETALRVATWLQRDLLRDRARLRLKIDSLRDDIELYYELLARVESATADAAGASAVDDSTRSLIARVQAIISARRPSAPVAAAAAVAAPAAPEEPLEPAPEQPHAQAETALDGEQREEEQATRAPPPIEM